MVRCTKKCAYLSYPPVLKRFFWKTRSWNVGEYIETPMIGNINKAKSKIKPYACPVYIIQHYQTLCRIIKHPQWGHAVLLLHRISPLWRQITMKTNFLDVSHQDRSMCQVKLPPRQQYFGQQDDPWNSVYHPKCTILLFHFCWISLTLLLWYEGKMFHVHTYL